MSIEDLSHACQSNNLDSVKELMLLPSIQLNIHEMVKIVFPDCDPLKKGRQTTIINIACRFSSVEIVERILEYSNTTIRDFYRNLPIHYAAGSEIDALRKVEILLAKNAESESYVNTKGYVGTPLLCAALAGNKDVVTYLLRHGASVQSERRLLHRVTASGNAEVFRLLIDNGADPLEVDDLGQTVLHCAARFNALAIIDRIIDRISKVEPLKKSSGDTVTTTTFQDSTSKEDQGTMLMNLQDLKGNTALHLATEFGKCETVKRLTNSAMCDFRIANKEGKTVFDIAKSRKKSGIIDHLSQFETPTVETLPKRASQNTPTNSVNGKESNDDGISKLSHSWSQAVSRVTFDTNKHELRAQDSPPVPERKNRRKHKNKFLKSQSVGEIGIANDLQKNIDDKMQSELNKVFLTRGQNGTPNDPQISMNTSIPFPKNHSGNLETIQNIESASLSLNDNNPPTRDSVTREKQQLRDLFPIDKLSRDSSKDVLPYDTLPLNVSHYPATEIVSCDSLSDKISSRDQFTDRLRDRFTEIMSRDTITENQSRDVENKSRDVENQSHDVENPTREEENQSSDVENQSRDVENQSRDAENQSHVVENQSRDHKSPPQIVARGSTTHNLSRDPSTQLLSRDSLKYTIPRDSTSTSLVDRVESLERRLSHSDENRGRVVDEKLKSMYGRINVIERRLGRLWDASLTVEKRRETQLALGEEVASLKDTVVRLQRRLGVEEKDKDQGKFSDKVLMRIARLIGQEQFQLRAFLDVTYEEYQQFQVKHPEHPVNVSFEILRTWRDNHLDADDTEKLDLLTSAFKEVDRDLGQTIKDILDG